MKPVLQTLQSYLGLVCEDRKPTLTENIHSGTGGYGGYGFPLLIRRSKPKKAQGNSDHEMQLSRRGASSRVHSLPTITNLVNSELNFPPSHCNLSEIHPNSGPERTGLSSPTCNQSSSPTSNQSMGVRDCLAKMYSRRVAGRKHVDEPFDKCTTEYYSCGKKGVQRRLACEFLREKGNVKDPDVDVHAHSCSGSDTAVSDVACMEGNASTQGTRQVRLCGISCRSGKEGSLDYVEHGKVRGLSIILADKPLIDDPCDCIAESSPISGTCNDHMGDMIMDKMGDLTSVCTDKVACVHDSIGDCEVGFHLEQELDEEENSLEVDILPLSSSPARGGYRKTFPPPLNSLAMPSYCDKKGQSPGACGAGYCLRSFRRDGRFVLQEVKTPISHRYFRISREDGRLKLELINGESDSSSEEDDRSTEDVYVGVNKSDCVVGVITEASYTSNSHAEVTCIGMFHASNSHAEVTCIGTSCTSNSHAEETCLGSPNIGLSEPRVGINAGCVRTFELVSTSEVNAESASPKMPCLLSAYAGSERPDEPTSQANLIFAKEAVTEDMVGQPPSSPRCAEIRALYDGPSSSIKSNWVRRPISAF